MCEQRSGVKIYFHSLRAGMGGGGLVGPDPLSYLSIEVETSIKKCSIERQHWVGGGWGTSSQVM